ncbi:MAG: ABC transporter permease [Geitlerinemataceae cyanobacterium]
MLGTALRRLAIAIPTLAAIATIVFAILALAPGDPMGEFATNPAITAEVRENIRRSLGLDAPIHVRYLRWVGALLRGDLGYSFNSRAPVLDLLLDRLPTTLWVVGSGYLLGVAIAFPLGTVSALFHRQLFDRVATTFAFLWFSLPPFLTGLLFIAIFSVWLDWLPFIYDSTLRVTDFNSAIAQLRQSAMPIAVLGLYQAALLVRFVRASVLDRLEQPYVRTAIAKGLSKRGVLLRHVLRNALIPIVTLVAIDLPSVLTGALVTEQVFRVPGIGSLLVESIYRSDTPVVMAIAILYAVAIVFFNALADTIYTLLDPRVSDRAASS